MSLVRIRTLALSLALSLSVVAGSSVAEDLLRPAVGKPLQAARDSLGKGKPKRALEQIEEARSVGKLSEYEQFVIAQMRGAALSAAGRPTAAAGEFEKVLAAGRLPAGEQLQVREALVGAYLRAKQYDKAVRAIKAYQSEGGTKAEVLAYLPQAYYLAGDYRQAASESARRIRELEKAGKRPSQQQLKLYASCYAKLDDMRGYRRALEKMVRHHPEPGYWADLIQRTARQPGFSKALELDTLRLLRATGNLASATAYMEMAQLAVQAGLPGEARSIIDEGYARGILGRGDAKQTERQGRLKKLVEERVAEDRATMAAADQEVASAASGDPLVRQGLAYVTYGEAAKGIEMIQAGIAHGKLESPARAQLQLAYALQLAGRRDAALKAFRQVGEGEGARDLARLWRLFLRQP